MFCSPPARVGIESGVACAQTRRSEPRAVATRRRKPRRATAGTATARAGRTTRRRTASRSPPCGTCCAGLATRSVVSTERAGVATCPPSNTIASGSALCVVVRGASFWGAFHQAVSWNGTAFFSISDSTVETWSSQQGAMDLQGGRVGVRGCVSLSLGFISLLVLWTNLVRVLSQARSGFSRRRRPGPSACGWAQGCHAPFASATTCSDRAWSTTCLRRAPSLQTICNRTAPYM